MANGQFTANPITANRKSARQVAQRIVTRRRSKHLHLEKLEARELMAADMVVQWNNHLIDVIRSDTTLKGPTWVSRNMGMVQLAVFDAVNAIDQRYSSYLTSAKGPKSASKEAAVATAAHDVLVGIYPQQQTRLDQLWSQSLATIPNGRAEDDGVAIGRRVASEILALRVGDGSTDPSGYSPINSPGHWSSDPLNPNQEPLGANWGDVRPFAIQDADDFQVAPPPELTSVEYADAYNEVKSLGEKDSSTRTADQTEIGIFWAYDRGGMGPPMILYNQNVQRIAAAKKNTLVDNARLFAMVNLAMADSGIVAWNTKYEYDFWRPITAIRAGSHDGNVNTVGDANWTPLGAPGGGVVPDFTPPFPAYTSGHAAFGAATFRSLANFYGTDKFKFNLTSDELPGVTRHYARFSQAAEENGVSRIYLGIHWNFDNTIGQQQGNAVADYVAAHFFQPVRAGAASIGVQNDHGGFATVNLPAGKSDVSLRNEGTELQVVNLKTNQVVFSTPQDAANAIRFRADNGARDLLTIDAGYGGPIDLPGGLSYVGRTNDKDGVWFNGTEESEQVTLGAKQLAMPGVQASLEGIDYVGIATQGGDDELIVGQNQSGRRVDLLGQDGHDQYVVSGSRLNLAVVDHQGIDTLDFSSMPSGVVVDLDIANGKKQAFSTGSSLELYGRLENVIGSQFADILRGNAADNQMYGLRGNDRLFGRAGDDSLFGGDGDDVLSGGDGNDLLYGEAGADILIGGRGEDSLTGDAGSDLLIGGFTKYDENDNALAAIAAEWSSPTPLSVRIANLTTGKGSKARKNGNYFLLTSGRSATVFDDLARDQIYGNASADWLIAGASDKVN